MKECICGKIISSNKLYCRTCNEQQAKIYHRLLDSIDRSEE